MKIEAAKFDKFFTKDVLKELGMTEKELKKALAPSFDEFDEMAVGEAVSEAKYAWGQRVKEVDREAAEKYARTSKAPEQAKKLTKETRHKSLKEI